MWIITLRRILPLSLSIVLVVGSTAQTRNGGQAAKGEALQKDSWLTAADIAQGRDLSLYEDGGHSNCGLVRYENEVCSIPAVRDFIWRHWRNHKRGYVRLTLGSMDAESTSHIFIEPDGRGVWHVAWRTVREAGVIEDAPDVHSVTWRPATEKEEVRGWAGTILSFRGRSGAEIYSL